MTGSCSSGFSINEAGNGSGGACDPGSSYANTQGPRPCVSDQAAEYCPKPGVPWAGIDGIAPDSLSGTVFACEGVQGATVLLNGPTGCKYYHSSLSDSQTIRMLDFDPLSFPIEWYFGQPRVPCTYLDNSDYVYGSQDKLEEALAYFKDDKTTELLCLVNSPGAALVGDDLDRIAQSSLDGKRFLSLQTPGYSIGMCAGFETAACLLVDRLASGAPANPVPRRVNLIGMPLYLRNYAGDVAEMTRLVELAGLEVGCVLCGGGSVAQVAQMCNASLNVVVHPEFGLKTAQFLEERFGTPYYVCDGAPVGFAATEKALADIAQLAGGDAGPVVRESEQARMRAFSFLSRLHSLTGLPKGVTFAVEGTYSELFALVSFLSDYLAMVPVAAWPAFPQADCYKDKLVELMKDLQVPQALDASPSSCQAELVFASGSTIARMQLEGHSFSGIETMLPTMGYLDVVPKTYLGIRGALQLVEMVLNGLHF